MAFWLEYDDGPRTRRPGPFATYDQAETNAKGIVRAAASDRVSIKADDAYLAYVQRDWRDRPTVFLLPEGCRYA